MTSLKRHLAEYLAEFHVCAIVLEPYSEGMVEAIDQYTENLPDE